MQLAQVNIAKLRAPLDDPQLADFVAGLDRMNALAESTPGFIWRLKDEAGNATDIVWNEHDPLKIVNMSVWDSLDALKAYTYHSDHTEFLKRRREWFERMDIFLALWWVPEGHRPSVADARERLAHLAQHGPTPHAFTFAQAHKPTNVT